MLIYASSLPDRSFVFCGPFNDQTAANLAHIPAYGLLSFLWLKTFERKDAMRSSLMVLILTGLLLFAVSDEIHQAFVPGRFASLNDIGLDLLGIALGLATYKILWTVTARHG